MLRFIQAKKLSTESEKQATESFKRMVLSPVLFSTVEL